MQQTKAAQNHVQKHKAKNDSGKGQEKQRFLKVQN